MPDQLDRLALADLLHLDNHKALLTVRAHHVAQIEGIDRFMEAFPLDQTPPDAVLDQRVTSLSDFQLRQVAERGAPEFAEVAEVELAQRAAKAAGHPCAGEAS